MRPRPRLGGHGRGVAVVVATLLLATAGCAPTPAGNASDDRGTVDGTLEAGGGSDDGAGGGLEGELLVSAAASLTDAFGAVATAFERANPGVDVVLNLGGSSALREQVLEGAPADVLATANTATMDEVVAAGATATAPVAFATNGLQVAVPRGNPAGITGLGDFDDDDLLLGLCAEQVPCGEFARRALARAGITPRIDTNEPDVRALLTKVATGELDAAITYVTDVAADDEVDGIDLPAEADVVATYPIAVLAEAPSPEAARAFVDFVRAEPGRGLLAAHGFGLP